MNLDTYEKIAKWLAIYTEPIVVTTHITLMNVTLSDRPSGARHRRTLDLAIFSDGVQTQLFMTNDCTTRYLRDGPAYLEFDSDGKLIHFRYYLNGRRVHSDELKDEGVTPPKLGEPL